MVWYVCVVIHSYIVKGAKSRKAFSSSSDLQSKELKDCLPNCYSNNKIRKTQNEHLNIICQNLKSVILNLMAIS